MSEPTKRECPGCEGTGIGTHGETTGLVCSRCGGTGKVDAARGNEAPIHEP